MGTTAMIKIDGDKLMNAIVQHGYHASALSADLGYNTSFLTQSANRGRISRSAANTLAKVYDIPLSEYEYVEPVEDAPLPWDVEPQAEVKPKERNLTDADIEALVTAIQPAIFSAMYGALRKAGLSDD